MEHNIAFCVMTYNHPDTVEEVLSHTVELYDRYGIDIYYFDASETDATKTVVESYIQNHAGNLYYISTTLSLEDRMSWALSGKCLKKHYDYIFLIKDRAYFDEITIKKLHEEAGKHYDVILMPPCHWPLDIYPQPEPEVYTDPTAFFRDYGTHTTNLETVLFNYDTMLKDVDWKEFRDRYFIDDVCDFLQVLVLFTGLTRLNNPRMRVLREREVLRLASNLSGSGWATKVFDVWALEWAAAVDMLPECYDEYKPYVKKRQTMQEYIFGSPNQLVWYAREKILTRQVAQQVKDIWSDLSDIPYECLEYIVDDRQELVVRRLAEMWVEVFRKQQFPQAYHMLHTNYWLKEACGSYIYNTLDKCFEVYRLELENGIEEGIFRNVYSMEDAVNKYQTMKYMLRRLEYDVAYDVMDRIVPYFVEQNMTVQCLSYIIQNECADKDKVICCWQQLCNVYKAGQ
jgi:hypothetical protein